MKSKQQQIYEVQSAQRLVQEAIEILQDADLDAHAQAYLIDQLAVLASDDHGFLDSSFNFDKLLEQLEEEEEDD